MDYNAETRRLIELWLYRCEVAPLMTETSLANREIVWQSAMDNYVKLSAGFIAAKRFRVQRFRVWAEKVLTCY
jgi:hypothetical protein